MEPQQDTTSNENTVDHEGNERIRSSNASSTSSTSSSRSSSEFQDPQLNSFTKDNLAKRNSNEEQEKDEQKPEPRDNNGSTLQSPPMQTMERPPDNGSGYRIPSYVFARNKSGNPVTWSTTSNESLFSIHTGNTSFTGDKYSWLLEAADLYNIPDQEDSPQTEEIPSPRVSSLQSPSSPNDEEDSVPDKEMENVNINDGTKPKPSMVEDQATPASSRSNESGHSFAFPFPLAEQQLGESVKSGKSVKSGGESVKSGKSVKSGLTSVPEQQKESPSTESNEEQTPSPAPEPATTSVFYSWFASCMACFTYRVKTTTTSTDKDVVKTTTTSTDKDDKDVKTTTTSTDKDVVAANADKD